jgi:hypothetical protein
MMPSTAESKEEEEEKRSSSGFVGATQSNATSLNDLFLHRFQQQQMQQMQQHQFLPPIANHQMSNFSSASQQWQRQQLQGRFGGGLGNMADTTTSFYSPATTSAVPPTMFSLQDQFSMPDYSNAMAAAAAMRNSQSAFFQAQSLVGSPGSNLSNDTGRAAFARSAPMSAANAALNLSSEVSFLRQQQEQERRAAAARVAAAEQIAAGQVDGGSLYLQERLGASSFGAQARFPSLSSPNMSSIPNQSDLARALLASRNSNNAASAGTSNVDLGLPANMDNNTSELSRMIMMLRGDFGPAPAITNTTASSHSATSMSDPSLAGVSWPRYAGDSLDLFAARGKGLSEGSTPAPGSPFKTNRKAGIKKRSPRPLPKGPKPSYRLLSTPKTPASMPYVLYSEDDDDYLTPYQCLLRKQLELFVADPEDVRCSSQQGRTTNIQVGQVGLRCRHCEGGLASRTKGAVYYSHSIDGIYQIGQNIGKVHLAERCYRIPDDIRRNLIALRNDSRRASSGKAYWSDRIRALGVYEEGNILKYRSKATELDEVVAAASEGITSASNEGKGASDPQEESNCVSGKPDGNVGKERVSNMEETAAKAGQPESEY